MKSPHFLLEKIMSARDEFPRTTCACDVCRAGCVTQPGFLGIGDLDRIVKHCGKEATRERFIALEFCASEGAKVARIGTYGIEIFSIPTIVPRQAADGRCTFLERDGRCAIHPVAPIGCSHCDTHTPRAAGGNDVIHAALVEIMGDEAYQRDHAALLAAGIVARPLAERKMAYARLEAEIREKTAAAAAETPQV